MMRIKKGGQLHTFMKYGWFGDPNRDTFGTDICSVFKTFMVQTVKISSIVGFMFFIAIGLVNFGIHLYNIGQYNHMTVVLDSAAGLGFIFHLISFFAAMAISAIAVVMLIIAIIGLIVDGVKGAGRSVSEMSIVEVTTTNIKNKMQNNLVYALYKRIKDKTCVLVTYEEK